MVSLDDDAQVIIATSVIIALLLLGLSTVIFSQDQSGSLYYSSKEERSDYVYYDVRDTYKKILKELSSDESVSNPFNHSRLSSLEQDLMNFSMRKGYFLDFNNKTYNSEEDVAEVELVFVGDKVRYVEVIRYDL